MDIETRLADFLRREAESPPYPGACCRIADRWVAVRRGFSPLAHYGREIRTSEDVQAWLVEPGGIAVAVSRVMRAGGFAKTKTPQIGDVGLVLHDGQEGDRRPMSMAIRGPRGWHSRNSGGLLLLSLDALWKAWSI